MSFRHKIINRSLTSTAAIAAALSFAAPALAQESGLDTVIITAQKRGENLQDVPISINAFTDEGLKEYGVVDTQSLQMVTPGLVFNNTSSGASPYLRGVGTRLSTLGLESSVAVYVDDRYVSRSSAALFDLADIERIEVLKGPQGTLYGRNATGGAIRVITKDPGNELSGELNATIGNFEQLTVRGYVGGPITDELKFQVSAASSKRNGYAENIFLDTDVNDRDFQAYRAKLLWDPTDTISMKLSGAYWQRDDSNANQQQALDTAATNVGLARGGIAGDSRSRVASAQTGNIKADESSIDYRLDVAFSFFDFSAITTYAENNLDGQSESDGTSSPTLDVYTFEDTDTFTQEIQFVSTNDSNLQWILGGYFFDQTGEANFTADFIFGFGPGILSNQMQKVETTAYAVFGQASYDVTDKISLTVGGRWSHEEKDVLQTFIPGTIPSGVGPLPFSDNESWSSFTPMATVNYHTDLGMIYFSYSQGFKSGGFNYPAASPTAVPLDPEEITQYELGFKGDLFDGRLRLNSALFYYDYKDLQVTRAATSGGSVSLTTENAANAKVFGFDADATWLVTDNFTITGGVNVLDSEYQDYDASARVPASELTGMPGPGFGNTLFDADGETLLRAPNFSGFVSARYEFGFDNATVPVVLTYSYKGDYKFDFIASEATQALEQDGYGLLGARISYVPDSGNWSASIWGNNITDEQYFNEVTVNGFSLRGNWAAPRTYGIDLSVNF